VDGDGRLRLFCALRPPGEWSHELARWQSRRLAGGRLVPAEHVHVTLAFLGSQAEEDAPAIVGALRGAAAGAGRIRLRELGYRETRSVGMLTFVDEGGRGTALAGALHEALEALRLYRREERPWLPHATVLRFRERPRLRPPLPGLGELVPSDAAVFISRLRRGGAQYDVLEAVPLGGR
jgi:RNA 2',3'-cyclic 3'-phosphodiesterase